MKGRIFGIKKTYFLRGVALLNFLFFVAMCVLSPLIGKPALWFYSFCLSVGGVEICKSLLFKIDSSLYLGTLLVCIGISGNIFHFTNTFSYAGFFILLSFIIASLVAFVFCGQRFHLIFAYSLFFVGIFTFLLTKSFINWVNFIAFVLPFLLLLILGVATSVKRK